MPYSIKVLTDIAEGRSHFFTKAQTKTKGIVEKDKLIGYRIIRYKKGKKKVKGMPQSQTATLPRHKKEEETDKTKQAQIEQTRPLRLALSFPSEIIAMLKGLKNTRTK